MRQATDPLATTCSDVIDSPAPDVGRTDAVPRRSTAAAVAEAPRDFKFTYSLRDIHQLAFLSAEERQAVRVEWKAWHRRNASFGALGVAGWCTGAAAAWACSFGAGDTVASIAALTGWQLPVGAVYGAAAMLALGLLVAAPLLFSTLAGTALGDAYLAGYADGIVTGVNRSLQITPGREQEMWGELHAAEARDLRAVRNGAAASVAPPQAEVVPPGAVLR